MEFIQDNKSINMQFLIQDYHGISKKFQEFLIKDIASIEIKDISTFS